MSERIVTIGTHRFTQIVCLDELGAGGACHEYEVRRAEVPEDSVAPHQIFGQIHFQNGPIKEVGVNGLHNEDLLVVVIDRLQHFQKGPFACRENALALTKIEEAVHWLNHRTAERQSRNVEGTSVK